MGEQRGDGPLRYDLHMHSKVIKYMSLEDTEHLLWTQLDVQGLEYRISRLAER